MKLRLTFDQANTQESIDLWRSIRERAATTAITAGGSLTGPIENLKLPVLGSNYRNQKNRKLWDLEHYKPFAEKIKKMNPQTTFTKSLLDDAFRAAISKAPKPTRASPAEIERVLTRVYRMNCT